MNQSIQTGTVPHFTASRQTGWLRVFFPQPFSTTPVVIAQVQTFVGSDSPGLRLQNVTNEGFEVMMYELQASRATSTVVGDLGKVLSDGVHPNAETLGWIAIG